MAGHAEELVVVATPTTFAMYVGGKQTVPVQQGRFDQVQAYPGANIRVVYVPEQELSETLSDITGLDGPALKIS